MVLTIKHEEEAGPGIAKMLAELLLQDIHDLKKFRVVGEKDINQMLSNEQRKQLAGCSDTSCLVEIAGAMGTKYTIDGTVGVVGQSNLLSLSLIDVSKAVVVSRKTAVVKGEREQLLESVHKLIADLMAPVLTSLPTAPTRGAPKVLQGPAATIPVGDVVPAKSGTQATLKIVEPELSGFDYALWGKVGVFSGAGVVLLGGVSSVLAKQSSDEFESTKDPKTMKDSYDKANTWSNVALGSYIAGGALAATGAVLWMMAPAGKAAVVPAANRDGVSLMLVGGW